MTAIATPTTFTRSRPWGRRVAIALLAALLLGSVGAGATVAHRQQDQLASAQSDRDAAVRALDAALAAAVADGVSTDQLATVSSRRAAILGEAAVAPRLHWYDNGQISHLRDQAGRLRSTLSTIPAIEAAAAAAARQQASTGLDALERALADANAIGVDTTALNQTVSHDRDAIAAATLPLLVTAVVSDLPVLTADVQQSITDRKAALAAAAKAALDGARADAQGALARADTLLTQVKAFPQLQIGSDPQTVAIAHQRIGLATTIDDFKGISALLAAPLADLGTVLTARSEAYGAMAAARGIVSAAQQNKIDATAAAVQLDALQPPLDAAGTYASFGTVASQIAAAVSPLQAEIARVTVGLGKVIVLSLANQSLTAYQDGVQYLTTLVTTGRPGMETPPGTYSVLRKNTPWHMVSAYPPGSPGYYTPAWVSWVMWFRNGGYGMHDAPWRGTYGPGTQAVGSHGCVNVPHDAMQQLFAWAEVGTKVIVV